MIKNNAKQLERRARILVKDYDIIIGIDPGVETGLAVWDKTAKPRALITVETVKIHDALESVKIYIKYFRVLVRVEDARLRKYLPREKSLSEERGKLQGAGSIKRDSKIWEDFLESLGVDYELLAPAAGRTKWSQEYFKTITGYTGKTSNHARDAAALVYGL